MLFLFPGNLTLTPETIIPDLPIYFILFFFLAIVKFLLVTDSKANSLTQSLTKESLLEQAENNSLKWDTTLLSQILKLRPTIF